MPAASFLPSYGWLELTWHRLWKSSQHDVRKRPADMTGCVVHACAFERSQWAILKQKGGGGGTVELLKNGRFLSQSLTWKHRKCIFIQFEVSSQSNKDYKEVWTAGNKGLNIHLMSNPLSDQSSVKKQVCCQLSIP